MTNGDNGKELWPEILNSVSVEYGWVKDYTGLYVSIAAAIFVTLVGILFLRRKRSRGSSI